MCELRCVLKKQALQHNACNVDGQINQFLTRDLDLQVALHIAGDALGAGIGLRVLFQHWLKHMNILAAEHLAVEYALDEELHVRQKRE